MHTTNSASTSRTQGPVLKSNSIELEVRFEVLCSFRIHQDSCTSPSLRFPERGPQEAALPLGHCAPSQTIRPPTTWSPAHAAAQQDATSTATRVDHAAGRGRSPMAGRAPPQRLSCSPREARPVGDRSERPRACAHIWEPQPCGAPRWAGEGGRSGETQKEGGREGERDRGRSVWVERAEGF